MSGERDLPCELCDGRGWMPLGEITDPNEPMDCPECQADVDSFVRFLEERSEWSEHTFGPRETLPETVVPRVGAILNHIRHELDEIAAEPTDVVEWVDVILLALDGAFRTGHSAEEVYAALRQKHAANQSRRWPDWRELAPGQPAFHIKG